MSLRISYGLILGLVLMAAGCARVKKDGEFHISGKLDGGSDVLLYLEKLDGERATTLDSMRTDAEGRFEFWGKVPKNHSDLFLIRTSERKVVLFLPGNSELTIEGKFSEFEQAEVSGDEVNEALTEYRRGQFDLYQAMISAKDAGRKLNRLQDFETWRSAEANADEAYLAYQEYIRAFSDTIRYPVLRAVAAMAVQGKDEFHFMQKLIKRVAAELPGHPITEALQARVREREAEWKGMELPFFVSSDLNGKRVSTEEYKGKRVLFYVWASYCRRSRIENARLASFFEQNPSTNLVLVSYSLDDDAQAWRNAVLEDSLPGFHHLISSNGWECPPVNLMGVRTIPASFLIDTAGKIQTTGLFGTDLMTDWGSF